MIQSFDLFRQTTTNPQTFKLGTKTGSINMLRIMLEGEWRRSLGVNNPLPYVGDVCIKGVERGFYEIVLTRLIFFFREPCPIFIVSIGT